jgi:hypothetical protein
MHRRTWFASLRRPYSRRNTADTALICYRQLFSPHAGAAIRVELQIPVGGSGFLVVIRFSQGSAPQSFLAF